MAKYKDTKVLQYKTIHIRVIYQQIYPPRGLLKNSKEARSSKHSRPCTYEFSEMVTARPGLKHL